MTYKVAVRAMCEFTAKAGDLDMRFTPSPTASEGINGHMTVVKRRDGHYLAEIPLKGEYPGLLVTGRADGYDPTANRLEEIKTHRGDIARIPDNHRALHWAQAKVYGWLMCQARKLKELDIALVYFEVLTQSEQSFVERYTADELEHFFNAQCAIFLEWAKAETAHRIKRDQALTEIAFPYPNFRHGQRDLAENVYRTARDGGYLLAQATTGIGKTLATSFPMLKAMPQQNMDRLFFLSAKTPGRRLALEALKRIAAKDLRVLEHIARDKACVHPEKSCHGKSCPLAQGFYDKLPAARMAACKAQWLDSDTILRIARQHGVCPYYLSQELCRWSDVVVGDYNYYFDMGGLLYSLTQLNEWRVGVLVDEAHNLVDRARGMYSAELKQSELMLLIKSGPKSLRGPLRRVAGHWEQINRVQKTDYEILPTIPDLFVAALQKAVSAITDHLTEQPDNARTLLEFYLNAMLFCKLAEAYGPHSLFDITKDEGALNLDTTLCLRNIVPAPFLHSRFSDAHTATLFSATLRPAQYYQDLLGMPEGTRWLDVASPFAAEQLKVVIARNLSTRYPDRDDSLDALCHVMARQFKQTPGNYLAFLSSYAYLEKLRERFIALYPHIPTRAQNRQMDETARHLFLAGFTEDSQGLGFAVLGGAFGEGVDLPGKRLIGAFIATLGLPQINEVNEEIKARVEEMFGAAHGYDYAYLYPGLQKVVQAAGRVIRTTTDQGCVYLLDDRFANHKVRRLLPNWWQISVVTL